MSILQRMKAASLELRKAKHPLSALAQTVIGEAEMIGKNDGNREVTDSEVLSRVKKFLTGVNDTIALIKEPTALAGLNAEREWLECWLPAQLSEGMLESEIGAIKIELNAGPKDMGKVLQALKAKYDGRYDGKQAAAIAKSLLA